MELERRDCIVQLYHKVNQNMGGIFVDKAKPFEISKYDVFEAYKRVKANRGAAGIDNQSIADFEQDWKNNLYKLWNRMSSGSYFPPPVRRVEIPKDDGQTRPLGIPTVSANCTKVQPPIGNATIHIHITHYMVEVTPFLR